MAAAGNQPRLAQSHAVGELVDRLQMAFAPAADPVRAAGMAAYMRGQFDFVGIASPARRALQAPIFRAFPQPTSEELVAMVDACWLLPEREYQYAALDYLSKHVSRLEPARISDVERWIVRRSWWDTVDVLCRHGAGALVRADPSLRRVMDRWLASPNMWLIRSAILHQERWGADADIAWVFAACAQHTGHPDFFVRKAIGWVLRTYAHRGALEADEVRTFIGEHSDELSGLSKREAMVRVRH